MQSTTKKFRQTAAAALANDNVQANLAGLYTGFHQARLDAAADTPDWEAARERGRAIKARTLDNLDYYLEAGPRR